MINIVEAAVKIKKQNAEFGYIAEKLEIANEIWSGYLSSADRLEIMNLTNIQELTQLGALRECVKTLSQMF